VDNSLLLKNTYDVHLASDRISAELEQTFHHLGFRRDAFVGGTTGVVHPCHYSAHPSTLASFRSLWRTSTELLQDATKDAFHGYAEAEVTPGRFRRHYEWKPFEAGHTPPFGRLTYSDCPPDHYKDLDVHFTVELRSLDPNLKAILEGDLNFYFVDIRRPSGNVVRVYTFQPLGLKRAPQLFWSLADFLNNVGGFEGKIKLEATYGFGRFPEEAHVPPVLMRMPDFINNAAHSKAS
jgi:hypothetical protein